MKRLLDRIRRRVVRVVIDRSGGEDAIRAVMRSDGLPTGRAVLGIKARALQRTDDNQTAQEQAVAPLSAKSDDASENLVPDATRGRLVGLVKF